MQPRPAIAHSFHHSLCVSPLSVLFFMLHACSAPSGEAPSDTSAAIDLRRIDSACTRMIACGVPTRFSTGSGPQTREIGDCRVALGTYLAGPTLRSLSVTSGGMTASQSDGTTEGTAETTRIMNCVAAANTCEAIRACRGHYACAAGEESRCEGTTRVLCGSGDGTRLNCADQGLPCTLVAPMYPVCYDPNAPSPGAPRCEGNTLLGVRPTRLDCGANARCSVSSPGPNQTLSACTPTGEVCIVALDGSRRCGAWTRWPDQPPTFTVPAPLLTVDRPTTGPCTSMDRQGASECADGTHLRFCLGGTERTIACSEFGATRCETTSTSLDSAVRGVCR